ncbi:MAG TPA: hypothetical protein VN380_24785 [Thermoanaerobaculia bacterium]|nr:hypothetical protein [Thermoanaerobaculia bacterium]
MKNRIDDLANRLSREGRAGDIEAQLPRLRNQRLNNDELESWHHLWGIVAFQRGDHATALSRFEEGAQVCPSSGVIRFSLAQERLFLNDRERAFLDFDELLFPGVPRDYALAAARYAYLWDELDRGWRYAYAFLPEYFKLGIADDHFLYVRGLPFFGQTWAYLAAFAILAKRLEELSAITVDAEKRLSEFDFSELKLRLQGYESGNLTPWLTSVEEEARRAEREGWPEGYPSMQAAAIAAHINVNMTAARQRLESVKLTEKDFAWLADIRTLALCELASHAGDGEGEKRLKSVFLTRQPLLFEPDHAVNFDVLGYQELLKRDVCASWPPR